MAAKLLKESHWEAFSKESEVIKAARWAYYRTHCPSFEQEGSHDLSFTFWEMATLMNLLGNEIHKVEESWTGWKDLKAAHQYAKSSPKDSHFFRVVSPTEMPKIMGLKGIHSPKTLQQHSRLAFCPWCRKEG